MEQLKKVGLDKSSIRSGETAKVTVEYEAEADREVTVTATGLTITPSRIGVKGSESSQEASLKVEGSAGYYMLTFSMSGSDKFTPITVT